MTKRRDGLRHRRQQLGFTQEGVADALGVATSTFRGWERGANTPRVGFRPKLARLLDVSLAEVGRWFDGDTPPAAPAGLTVPRWLGHLATLEQGASRIWTYEPVVVPGLLQTPQYMMALHAGEPGRPPRQLVERRVQVRLARQAVLDNEPEPLVLRAIIDESVLLRVAGDRSVMAAQLEHLAGAAARPNIDLRVLPLDAGVFSASWGSFTVLTSQGADEPYMAWVEDQVGAHYLDRPGEVETHTALFEHLVDRTLPADKSLDLIWRVNKDRYS